MWAKFTFPLDVDIYFQVVGKNEVTLDISCYPQRSKPIEPMFRVEYDEAGPIQLYSRIIDQR